MTDQEKLRKEIDGILGFDFQEAIETMLENLKDGVLAVPFISEEQKKQIKEAKAKYQSSTGKKNE